jgi:hypothetical protein
MMPTQSKVLNQLKLLGVLHEQGGSHAAIEQTLEKIIRQELSIAQKKKEELDRDLQAFESQYKMSSEEFSQKFHAGTTGDDLDFVEWDAFYQLNQSLQQQIDILMNGYSA